MMASILLLTYRKAWIWDVVCLDRVGNFCDRGDVLSGGRVNSASVQQECVALGESLELLEIFTRKDV